MSALEELISRYRVELRRLVVQRRELDAHIAAKREILLDLKAAHESGSSTGPASNAPTPPRRGRITQMEAVERVLASPEVALTAGEIYAAAIEAGAGGSERSLRNVLSRKVRDGELLVDRRRFPQRYRAAGERDED